MTLLFLVIFLLYSLLILAFAHGLKRLEGETGSQSDCETGFSILVPFRNESGNLAALLESIRKLDYPAQKMEVLLIDDASEDNSVELIEKFIRDNQEVDLKLLANHKQGGSPKKKALEMGIREAVNPWIVTTDADCVLPPGWLRAMDALIRKKDPVMLAAPLTLESGKGFLDHFQLLDILSLQGATMGSFGAASKGIVRPFLCNGANLAYRKDAFAEVGGFEGNLAQASGDDVFLLEKMVSIHRSRVIFLKSEDAIVRTRPEKSWKELLQQRVRWASKTTAYRHFFGKGAGILVFAANAGLVFMVICSLLQYIPWSFTGILFLVKFNVDFFLLYRSAQFFGQTDSLRHYLPSSLLYPIFSALVALMALAGGYQWKGRNYHKGS